jgi:hypothetical protein
MFMTEAAIGTVDAMRENDLSFGTAVQHGLLDAAARYNDITELAGARPYRHLVREFDMECFVYPSALHSRWRDTLPSGWYSWR